jgi:hypothetical protein
MRRAACLVGLLALAGTGAAQAVAEPRPLLDAPRGQDVAVAGGEVLVAAATAGGGARLSAIPAAGGPARVVFEVPRRGRGWTSVLRLSSSSQLTALLVAFLDSNGYFRDWRVYAGPPAGPLALVQRVRPAGRRPVWTPLDVDVHATACWSRSYGSPASRPASSCGRRTARRRRLSSAGSRRPPRWRASSSPTSGRAGERTAGPSSG